MINLIYGIKFQYLDAVKFFDFIYRKNNIFSSDFDTYIENERQKFILENPDLYEYILSNVLDLEKINDCLRNRDSINKFDKLYIENITELSVDHRDFLTNISSFLDHKNISQYKFKNELGYENGLIVPKFNTRTNDVIIGITVQQLTNDQFFDLNDLNKTLTQDDIVRLNVLFSYFGFNENEFKMEFGYYDKLDRKVYLYIN